MHTKQERLFILTLLLLKNTADYPGKKMKIKNKLLEMMYILIQKKSIQPILLSGLSELENLKITQCTGKVRGEMDFRAGILSARQ